jgi:hypothetical protein
MAGMLDLADVFELIRDGLDDSSLPQEQCVRPVEQAVVHLFAQLGDEAQSVGHQQVLGQRLGEIAFVPKELTLEAFRQLGNGIPIIDVAWSQAKGQQLTLVIDDQVQQTVEEPADRGFATRGSSGKDTMLVDAGVVTDRKRGRVNEADTGTAAQLGV